MDAEVIGKVNEAPAQQAMAPQIEAAFGKHEALLVKQTMRGCIQECLGCEAKSEFQVAGLEWSQVDGYKVNEDAMNAPNEMYAIEQSSCCCRLCWRDGRPFNMEVSTGGEPGGDPLVNFLKPCGCPIYFTIPLGESGKVDCPCCCMLPEVNTTTPDGVSLNSQSKYICDINMMVPKLKYSENGEPVYIVKPETCCGGCCIQCSCGGKGCIYIPFYFHDPSSGEVINHTDSPGYSDKAPQIRKVWAGLKKECCSTADTFAVKFPLDITANRKAGLLGMTFLLDFTVFERQQDSSTAG